VKTHMHTWYSAVLAGVSMSVIFVPHDDDHEHCSMHELLQFLACVSQ
jgi:hypothetical protein